MCKSNYPEHNLSQMEDVPNIIHLIIAGSLILLAILVGVILFMPSVEGKAYIEDNVTHSVNCYDPTYQRTTAQVIDNNLTYWQAFYICRSTEGGLGLKQPASYIINVSQNNQYMNITSLRAYLGYTSTPSPAALYLSRDYGKTWIYQQNSTTSTGWYTYPANPYQLFKNTTTIKLKVFPASDNHIRLGEIQMNGSFHSFPIPPVFNQTLVMTPRICTTDSVGCTTIFDPFENLKIILNLTYSNGTIAKDADCNITLRNGSISTGLTASNFTICGFGCSYSGTMIESMTMPVRTNPQYDLLTASICHPGARPTSDLVLNVSCIGGFSGVTESDLLTITPENIPRCSGVPVKQYFKSTKCIRNSSIQVSTVYPGTQPYRVEISGLRLNRQFIPYSEPDVLYNSTTHNWRSPTLDYPEPGDYLITSRCYDPSTKLYNETNMTAHVKDFAPILVPYHLSNGVQEVDLGTNISYSADNFSFMYTAVDYDLNWISFKLYNSTHLVYQYNSSTNSVPEINGSLFRYFGANPWNISILVGDDSGNKTSYNTWFYVFDIVTPVCIGLTDSFIDNNTIYNFSVSCYDEAFFSFNLSCDNGFYYYIDGLTQEVFNFENSTLIDFTTICNYQYCDGHTKEDLTASSFSTKDDKTVKFFTEKGGEAKNVSITSREAPLSLDTFKDKDRIRYTYKFSKPGKKTFTYKTSKEAIYLKSDKYHGWIVDPISKTWIDYNLKNDPKAIVTVNRIGFTEWEIIVDTTQSVLEFESIGELNCNSGSFTITAVNPLGETGINYGDCPTKNTGSSIFFIGFFMVCMTGAVIGYIFQPLIGILSGIGFIISAIILANCSPAIAGITVAFGIIIVVSMVFTER